jgi:predicted RNase H-like HicB family nuclease
VAKAYWLVECPGFQACNSQGKTKEEAIANIKEAANSILRHLKKMIYLCYKKLVDEFSTLL